MSLMRSNILVTGGCGFLGRNLIPRLVSLGSKVRCLDVVSDLFLEGMGVETIIGDVNTPGVLGRVLPGMDVVVHLACNVTPKTSNSDPCRDIETNVCGSVRLLEECVRCDVKRFVFVSSGGTVYGVPHEIPIPETHPNNPDCSYGITKLAIEKYVGMYSRERGLSTCTLRLANPYGEYQRVKSAQGAVAVFCYKALNGETIEVWGDGSIVRDFVYVGDAIDAVIETILRKEVTGEINIGSGKGTSINELLDSIDEVLGKKTRREYKPGRIFDVPANVLKIEKAEHLLDWRPKVGLHEGIKKTLSWISGKGI